jgi:hypothetical protein
MAASCVYSTHGCPSFLGFCLYTASRAQMPLKLRALIDFLTEKCGAR